MTEIYTARCLATDVLTGGEVVPVWMGACAPLVALPYEAERAPASLLPEAGLLSPGEWPDLSPGYWRMLDQRGFDRIAASLGEISARHGGKPVCLVDHEDVEKGHRSLRTVFGAWWEAHSGERVYEILEGGEKLHHADLLRQARPKIPKVWREDRRWRGVTVPAGRMPSPEEVAAWLAARHWQEARSQTNRHAYTHRSWGDAGSFLRVVLFIRENGEQEVYARQRYTYLASGGYKHWTMGDPLPTTVILNRKKLGQDAGDEQPRLSDDVGEERV